MVGTLISLDFSIPPTHNISNVSVVTKYLFGDASKESIVEISQGQLNLVRPDSPSGFSELIFEDAAAAISPSHPRASQNLSARMLLQRWDGQGKNFNTSWSCSAPTRKEIFLSRTWRQWFSLDPCPPRTWLLEPSSSDKPAVISLIHFSLPPWLVAIRALPPSNTTKDFWVSTSQVKQTRYSLSPLDVIHPKFHREQLLDLGLPPRDPGSITC